MDKSAIKRWAVLLTIGAVTAIASFYPTNELIVSPKGHYRPPKLIATPPTASPTPTSTSQVAISTGDAESESLDPFAPRGWQPPPPPEPAKPPPAIVQAPVAPQPVPST